MKRIMLTLSDEEFGKLALLARDTLRTPNEQARHLLQGILFGDGVVSAIDDLTKRVEALEEDYDRRWLSL